MHFSWDTEKHTSAVWLRQSFKFLPVFMYRKFGMKSYPEMEDKANIMYYIHTNVLSRDRTDPQLVQIGNVHPH